MSATGDNRSANEVLNLLEKAKVLVFDFDGTLVDSNEIKRKAFEQCFADYPKYFGAIIEYCRGNNHTPRQIKFRHVFENILQQPYTPEIEKEMLDRYASETTEPVMAAAEIPGATRFLQNVFLKKDIHLLSSTPHPFLEIILEGRGLRKYFKRVQGAPVNKTDWLKEFEKEDVFIGDSKEDCRSAKEAGISFVAVGGELKGETKYWIDNFEKFF